MCHIQYFPEFYSVIGLLFCLFSFSFIVHLFKEMYMDKISLINLYFFSMNNYNSDLFFSFVKKIKNNTVKWPSH
jgi:hypothetical protein